MLLQLKRILFDDPPIDAVSFAMLSVVGGEHQPRVLVGAFKGKGKLAVPLPHQVRGEIGEPQLRAHAYDSNEVFHKHAPGRNADHNARRGQLHVVGAESGAEDDRSVTEARDIRCIR
ncbi:hypothetical protein D3C71_1151510 [compost metagenome]